MQLKNEKETFIKKQKNNKKNGVSIMQVAFKFEQLSQV